MARMHGSHAKISQGSTGSSVCSRHSSIVWPPGTTENIPGLEMETSEDGAGMTVQARFEEALAGVVRDKLNSPVVADKVTACTVEVARREWVKLRVRTPAAVGAEGWTGSGRSRRPTSWKVRAGAGGWAHRQGGGSGDGRGLQEV